ncbi:MAG: magnesium/cobalt transporter CorA [Kosmotoga sp.]|nr:MAG: magnesium/cobalt transporter CorA [Kosmotoga sp.]
MIEGLKFRKKKRSVPGTTPGTLSIDKTMPQPKVRVIDYNKDYIHEKVLDEFEKLSEIGRIDENTVRWIDIQGLGDENLLRTLGDVFSIHPLVLEDIVNLPQRPKVDYFDSYVFSVMRMFRLSTNNQIISEQFSIIIGKNYVITFQEKLGDCLDPLRERLRNGKGIIRKMKADYLTYAVIDTIFDNYFPVLETIGDDVEELEDMMTSKATEAELKMLHESKHNLLAFRKELWPSREIMGKLLREDTPLISGDVKLYLRDCYDHIVHIIDIVETYKELTTELMNIYLSSLSNRLNEVMKVLTIISTIFIPLSFIAGVYGMNFQYMPELGYKYSYFILLGIMFAIGLTMLFVFFKIGWLGSKKKHKTRKKRK